MFVLTASGYGNASTCNNHDFLPLTQNSVEGVQLGFLIGGQRTYPRVKVQMLSDTWLGVGFSPLFARFLFLGRV